MGLPPTLEALMRSRSRCATFSTTSFSRVPAGPMAPGSSPPWPGSRATMMRRSVCRPTAGARGAALGGGGAAAAEGAGAGAGGLAGSGRWPCCAIKSPSGSVGWGDAASVCGAEAAGASFKCSAIRASSGSTDFAGYRSNTRRCWYAATGVRVNTWGTAACFRSITRRTTPGAFWPTRMPAMFGSSARTLATSSRSAGFRSMPSMSTARRGGWGTKNCLAASLVSDSMVTREYSGAGHTRTATMVAPRAICCTPSSSTRLPPRSSARRVGLAGRWGSFMAATLPAGLGPAR